MRALCAAQRRPWPQARAGAPSRAGCKRLALVAVSVDLLDGGAAGAAGRRAGGAAEAATRHAALRHPAAAAGGLVDLHHDGVHDSLQLLLLGLELVLLGQLVLVEPVEGVLHGLLDLLLVPTLELLLELLLVQGVAHREAVVLEAVLCLDLLLVGLVLRPELLGLLNHAVDLRLRQPALLVGDGDLVGLARRLVLGRDVQDTIGVNVKGHFDLGHATGCRRDAVQVEFAKHVVVLCHRALALEHLNQNSWLVVRVRRERLRLFGWYRGITFD
mmetsp:Transcript_67140/g.190417  ORF Transcript_67140/g.190417 Transcript_67140/m.190417 type:complete len:272 (-) Transcript_67140:232-1047(-)